jgi:hypothetical protein
MLWNTTESSTIGIKALNEDEPETRPRRRRKTPLLSPGHGRQSNESINAFSDLSVEGERASLRNTQFTFAKSALPPLARSVIRRMRSAF